MTVLTMPAGVERRTLRTERGPVVASYARPRPGNDRGVAVLMVTGYVGSKEDFWAVLPGIAEAGYHAWTYDQIGQFESPGPLEPEAYTIELLAEDLRTVMAQVTAEITGPTEDPAPLHLVGHCLGGFVARQAALADPDAVSSLSFLGCGPALNEPDQKAGLQRLEDELEKEGGALNLLWPTLKRVVPEKETGLRDFWWRKLETANPGFMHGTARAMGNEPDRSPGVRKAGVPALVVQGKRDRRVWPKSKFAAMAATLGARHIVIKDAAHSPSMEAPEETMAALLEFWRGLSAVQDVYSMRAGA
jgi:pimeloyl-ACP methyl ester carboxylesterase